ncbi:ABC transporter permease [Rhizobium sp. ARZ01]|uniref:ABC transporter permease n=1 Tax=Rhizobium sp. ARZ01 TaxID=2769313 RepID=UPI00177B880D|nr:ABC transporter permease [Rhizobium sp. ARZ01]MBD9375446.1 ABC transporter permease [Rhizobium sp. ARZ01]
MTGASSNVRAAGAIVSLVALVVAAIAITDADPLSVMTEVVQRALFTRAGFLEALLRAIPLTIMGLGVALAFRAKVFNIGMDGQLIAGSVLAVLVAPFLPLGPIGLFLLILVGMIGGGIWGRIAGELKSRCGGNEIIATIMLNYVAIQILSWLVRGPLQEAAKIIPRTDLIDAAFRLPVLLPGTRLHAGLIIALLSVAIIAAFMSKTRFGFKLSVVGSSSSVAQYAGIRPGSVASLALLLSGAMAGLAGIVEVSGLYGRLQEGFAPGFGIAAIAVALVARLNPLLIPFSAFGFSLLYAGLGSLARKGTVPFPIINIIEAAIILIFLASSVMSTRAKEVNGHG